MAGHRTLKRRRRRTPEKIRDLKEFIYGVGKSLSSKRKFLDNADAWWGSENPYGLADHAILVLSEQLEMVAATLEIAEKDAWILLDKDPKQVGMRAGKMQFPAVNVKLKGRQ